MHSDRSNCQKCVAQQAADLNATANLKKSQQTSTRVSSPELRVLSAAVDILLLSCLGLGRLRPEEGSVVQVLLLSCLDVMGLPQQGGVVQPIATLLRPCSAKRWHFHFSAEWQNTDSHSFRHRRQFSATKGVQQPYLLIPARAGKCCTPPQPPRC